MFERNGVQVRHERPARKEPLTEADVKKLLSGVNEVVIAKGKKSESHAAKDVKPDMLKGPSGNFRAPMLVRVRSSMKRSLRKCLSRLPTLNTATSEYKRTAIHFKNCLFFVFF